MKWALRALIAALVWLSGVVIWIATGPSEKPDAQAKMAVVLGAAVDGSVPSPVFAARIDHAIMLYQEGLVEQLFFTGARSPEDTVSEAAASRDYAIRNGVPASVITFEEQSRTTHQNLSEVRKRMRVASVPDVVIVSDPLHLRRAGMMADDLGFSARLSATPTTRYQSWSTKLPFLIREVYFVHHYWIFGE